MTGKDINHQPVSQVCMLEIDRLVPHPDNPNRMSKTAFNKLVNHIKRSGNYEPVVVRAHPSRGGFYQIINGHHRVKALEKLQYRKAGCVVWRVDDDGAMMLLATLNRLRGIDGLDKKASLVNTLSARFCLKDLWRMLPDSKKTIERLSALSRQWAKNGGNPAGAAPPVACGQDTGRVDALFNPVVFFLDDKQKKLLDDAISIAVAIDENPEASKGHCGRADLEVKATAAQRRSAAVVRIARFYISGCEENNEAKKTDKQTANAGD